MKILCSASVLLVLALSMVGIGQQQVPFQGNIPLAPQGLAGKPLPDKPLEFDTGEGQRIRVVVMTRGLVTPWSMAFIPDGSILVTERSGQLRRSGPALGESLRRLERRAAGIREEGPQAAGTGHREQPEFALVALGHQGPNHRVRVVTCLPVGLRHRCLRWPNAEFTDRAR